MRHFAIDNVCSLRFSAHEIVALRTGIAPQIADEQPAKQSSAARRDETEMPYFSRLLVYEAGQRNPE